MQNRSKILIGILLLLRLFSVWIWFLLVGQTQKIVHADMMKLRQRCQNPGRNHALPALIVSVGSLGHIDLPAKFFLCKVRILTQIADSFVSFSHSNHHGHYNTEQFVLLIF